MENKQNNKIDIELTEEIAEGIPGIIFIKSITNSD